MGWNAYQNDLDIRSLVTMTRGNTSARSSVGAPLELSNLLVVTIPELWAMHAIIFEFMGYDRLVKEKRELTRPNHGITFYETRHLNEKRTRRYLPKKEGGVYAMTTKATSTIVSDVMCRENLKCS